jgi:hypothetical protein
MFDAAQNDVSILVRPDAGAGPDVTLADAGASVDFVGEPHVRPADGAAMDTAGDAPFAQTSAVADAHTGAQDDTRTDPAGETAPPTAQDDARTGARIGLAGNTDPQGNEDLIAESLLAARFALAGRGLDTLFYIEIGLNPQARTSSTGLFYRRHAASGVLVADDADQIDDLRRSRPRDIVLPLAAGVGASRLPINDLFDRLADQKVDFLSVNLDGAEPAALEALDFALHRPLVIQCRLNAEADPNGVPGIVRALQENGYTLAARTKTVLLFADSADADAALSRPAVDSFDVFDTLIARRCVDPHLVFATLEASNGIDGFAGLRRAAEQAVTGPAMTLDTIYTELGRRLGLDTDAAAALMQAEIDAELAEVIPIAENLGRVKDGDLLLSDMYLPPDAIRALLDKAGLDRRVGLVVSANGKQSGHIWKRVRSGFNIGRHLGDNPVSDVEMPRRFSIASEHTRLAEPTQVERWCFNNQLRGLGELIRAARLRIATQDPLARRLLWVQTQYNFPTLLLASMALHRHVVATGASRLLFSARDCYLWHGLYRALFPDVVRTEYFYTSRRTRVDPSPAYRAYCRSRLGPGSLLVDVCGSGWSSARLMETLGLHGQALYFLHRIAPIALYEQRHPTPDICRVDALLGPDHTGLKNNRLEMCNYAPHGTVTGMQMAAGVAVPVFDMEDRSVTQLALVEQQASCFRGMVADTRATLPGDSVWFDTADIAKVVVALYELLCLEDCLPAAFAMSHHREDLQALGAMRFPEP